MAAETGTPGPRLPQGPVPIESTSKRDGPVGNRPKANGNRPSSLERTSSSHKKRKASQMENSGDIYRVTRIRPSIKEEPEMPVDDSPSSSGSISPGPFSIKQKLTAGKVLQGYSSANGKRGATIFGPSPILHHSSVMVKKETDWPGEDRRKVSNVKNRRGSSSLTELSMWDVSESEMYTTDIEEESSDGEIVGSGFSLGIIRQESVKSEELSRGSDNLHGEESNDLSSRTGTVQDQNYNYRARPTEPATNGNGRTELNTPQRSISHNHENPTRDESNAIPANGVTGRNSETTVTGKKRQRAAAKSHISTRDISRSWRTANPEDKMLMKMKLRGCGWLEIRKAWEELTGEWPAASTLPNRYQRVKDNLTRLKSGDGKRLLDAVAEVEAEFHRSKWGMIAETMERAGAAKYSKAFIQRTYVELSRKGTRSGSLMGDESSDTSMSDSDPQDSNAQDSNPQNSHPQESHPQDSNPRNLNPRNSNPPDSDPQEDSAASLRRLGANPTTIKALQEMRKLK